MTDKGLATQNGGTHGSPVGPLLLLADAPIVVGLPPGEARLRPVHVVHRRIVERQEI